MKPPLVQGSMPLTRINVTPIIDVALVLVIILLITAPMLAVADLEVDLPRAHARDSEEYDFVSVTLSRAGELAVDDQLVASLDDLPDALRARLASVRRDDILVVVRADAGLPHGTVRAALTAVRESGADRVAIAIRQGGAR
jgi:biopolymer transport protein ExbD